MKTKGKYKILLFVNIIYSTISFSQDSCYRPASNIVELHSLSVANSSGYIVAGNFNSNFKFENIKDSTAAFVSSFIVETDSNEKVVRYIKFDARGYLRILNCVKASNGFLSGLILFNNEVNHNKRKIINSENWSVAAFMGKDTLKLMTLDSASNYEFLDCYFNSDTIVVLLKQKGNSEVKITKYNNAFIPLLVDSIFHSAPKGVDYLKCKILNDSSFILVGHNVDLTVECFINKNSEWSKFDYIFSNYRYLGMNTSNEQVELFVQKSDSVFKMLFNIKHLDSAPKLYYLFKGNLISVSCRKIDETIFYYGSSMSGIEFNSSYFYLNDQSNSFLIIDFENDGILDTLIDLGLQNVKDIIFVDYSIIAFTEDLNVTLSSEFAVINYLPTHIRNFCIKSLIIPAHKYPVLHYENKFDRLNIYPNPTSISGGIQIIIPASIIEGNLLSVEIEIYAANGRLLKSDKLSVIQNKAVLDLNNIIHQSGVYIVKIITKVDTYNFRLVVN